jgi:hypothetical protein
MAPTVATDRVRIIKHEAVPDCGSFEVRFADGRPSEYFYWDDIPARRLRPDLLDRETAGEGGSKGYRGSPMNLCGPASECRVRTQCYASVFNARSTATKVIRGQLALRLAADFGDFDFLAAFAGPSAGVRWPPLILARSASIRL